MKGLNPPVFMLERNHSTEATPTRLTQKELEKMDNLEKISHFLNKGDFVGLMGAALSLWQEYFGTPEEKAKIEKEKQSIQAEKKEADSKKTTHQSLRALRADVEEKRVKRSEKEHTHEDENGHEHDHDHDHPHAHPRESDPTITPKAEIKSQIEEIYGQNETVFKVENLHEHFGKDYGRLIVNEDPLTGRPITFLGKELSGGINVMMIPFLKIAEQELRTMKLAYEPKARYVGGFADRNMKLIGKPLSESSIPSFHRFGLAIDIDPGENGVEAGRGDIPDQVALAMARAGFAWGLVGNKDFPYLGRDPMHFQLRFPPDSEMGQRIISSSKTGKEYWAAIEPVLQKKSEAVA